jgi:acetyltransferase-like isoleucine patch superfamily enzyme
VKAYRVRTGRTIAPFQDPVRDLFVGARTIADWQEAAVRGAGLDLTEVDAAAEAKERPCVLFHDDVFFTEMALRNFLADAMGAKGDVALAVDAAALHPVEPLQDARPCEGGFAFDLFRLESDGPPDEIAARSRPLLLARRALEVELRLPPIAGEGKRVTNKRVEAPITARIVANVRHWIHLLRLSQLSIGVEIVERLRKKPRALLSLRLMKGSDPWRIARKVNFVDPSARVHPTADLECAVVGPNAVIHAHAHVHRSVLGPGVEIGDHARVVGCALAEGVHVMRASYFALSAALPGGTLASYKAQLSLFGRDVFLTSSALLIDAKLDGEVEVEHRGARVSIGSPFLGVCLGHRVTVGANVAILPGRAISNGVTVVAPPETFVRATPEYPEGTLLTVRNGRLEPV